MKYLILLLALTGCGKVDRIVTHWTGNLTHKCSEFGVLYVQSDSGLAPAYRKDGTLVECKP